MTRLHRLPLIVALVALTAAPACDDEPAPGISQDAGDVSLAPETAKDSAGETATDVPPTDVPPADVPPADVPPTDVPPTDVPPADVPPTDVPPADVPPADAPPADVVTDAPPLPDVGPDTDDDAAQDVGTDGPADVKVDTGPPPIVETVSTFIGDWMLQPGDEVTKCVVKRLDNMDELWVQQIRTELAAGSHHMIIYKSEETEEQLTPFNCEPFLETLSGETVPLMITQIPNETLTFPPGVAFKFEPNQMIRLEAHYLNYYPTEITAHGDVFFDAIPADAVIDEANILFYGTPDFNIPANSTHQTPWHFLGVPEGSKVFATTGHTHQYGDVVDIQKSEDGAAGNDIYPMGLPYTWDEPPVVTYDPPLNFAAGEGFRYRCTWTNTSNSNVGFGESANKEMCFLWAYYYPSVGYRICVNPGDIAGGAIPEQICCPEGPGSFLCDLVKGYLNGL